nr:uncharacterized protein LOC111509860 [Leptinotarsa decemlineata]
MEGEEVREVYVDAGASMEEEKMGIGWAYKRRGEEWNTGNERITWQSSVNEAELIAIERVNGMWSMEENLKIVSDSAIAVERVKAGRVVNKRVARIQRIQRIITWRRGHDAKNVVNAKAHEKAQKGINKEQVSVSVRKIHNKVEERKRIKESIKREWQRKWERGETGRLFYRFCGAVGHESLDLSRKAIQLFTGHGKFPGYLARFNLGPEVPCRVTMESRKRRIM